MEAKNDGWRTMMKVKKVEKGRKYLFSQQTNNAINYIRSIRIKFKKHS